MKLIYLSNGRAMDGSTPFNSLFFSFLLFLMGRKEWRKGRVDGGWSGGGIDWLRLVFDWWVMGAGTANGSAKRREPSQQSIQGLFFLSLSWNANGMKKRNGMWLMDEEIGFVVFFSLWVMGRNAPNAPQREDKQTNKTNWIHSNQSKQSKESVDGASQFKEAN